MKKSNIKKTIVPSGHSPKGAIAFKGTIPTNDSNNDDTIKTNGSSNDKIITHNDNNNNNNTIPDDADADIALSVDSPVPLSIEQTIVPQSDSNPSIALRPSPFGAIIPSELVVPTSLNRRKPKGSFSRLKSKVISKSKVATPNLKKYNLNIDDFPKSNRIPDTYFERHGVKWWKRIFIFFGVNRSYDEYTNRFPLSYAEAQWFWFCLLHLKISIESEEEEEGKSLFYFGRLFLTEKVFDWLPSFYRERHSGKCWESLMDCFDLEYTKLNDGGIPPFFAKFVGSDYERPISKSNLIIYLKVFCNIRNDLSFSLTSD